MSHRGQAGWLAGLLGRLVVVGDTVHCDTTATAAATQSLVPQISNQSSLMSLNIRINRQGTTTTLAQLVSVSTFIYN